MEERLNYQHFTSGYRPIRLPARRSAACWAGGALKIVHKPLPEDQQEDQQSEEQGGPEDVPGVAQVLALARQDVREDKASERDRRQQADDARQQHLGRQAHKAGDAGRRLRRVLEARHLPGARVGHQRAQ